MRQTSGGKEEHDKNTPGIRNSVCKGLEGRERLLPETTS